jgi:hypothetical protein
VDLKELKQQHKVDVELHANQDKNYYNHIKYTLNKEKENRKITVVDND